VLLSSATRTNVAPRTRPRELDPGSPFAAGALFPGATGTSVHSALRRLGQAAGVRHWYGTAAHRASGGDILITQRLRRHSNPSTTAGSAAVAGAGLRTVIDSLTGHAGALVPEPGGRGGHLAEQWPPNGPPTGERPTP